LLELDTDLKQRFKKAARAFKTRLELKPDRWTIRNLITNEKIGYFIKSNRLTTDELTKIVDKGGICGVDGSTNNGGGSFPYIITLQQAMAKFCNDACEDILLSDAFSPFSMEDRISEEEYRTYVKRNLALLEASAAILALEEYKPAILLMDGSLVRFKIEAPEYWEKLKNKALEVGTLLVGVVEGISTSIISESLKDELPCAMTYALDWEMLFGLLDIGEALVMAHGLFKEGFCTCFLRTSADPKPIGLDVPEEQQQYLEDLHNLIYTITPKNGRGIPLWLDIIDNEIKISDKMMDMLIKTYLGQDYSELIIPKRNKRQR
jgi:hypothetical protein